jgi:phage antirepressor YoqD-like protein
LFARAVLEAQKVIAARDARIAELEPKALMATKILDADGDYSVRDAAQELSRAGIKVGQQRLFIELERKGWISRAREDGRYRPYQKVIDAGYMSVLPQSHHHPHTGELVLDPPQCRVTQKGVERLLTDMGKWRTDAQ